MRTKLEQAREVLYLFEKVYPGNMVLHIALEKARKENGEINEMAAQRAYGAACFAHKTARSPAEYAAAYAADAVFFAIVNSAAVTPAARKALRVQQ